MDNGLSTFVGLIALFMAAHGIDIDQTAVILFVGTALAASIAGLEETPAPPRRRSPPRRRRARG